MFAERLFYSRIPYKCWGNNNEYVKIPALHEAHVFLDGEDNAQIYVKYQQWIDAKKEKINEGKRTESDGASRFRLGWR